MLSTKGEPCAATNVMETLKETKWANAETKMTLFNIRLHLRILRRLSVAVCDPINPSYKESALYYMERNEEVFGRRAKEVSLQESTKYFDAFQVCRVVFRRF